MLLVFVFCRFQYGNHRLDQFLGHLQLLLHNFFFNFVFFFNDSAPTELYTLSLHDALPISGRCTSRCCSCWSICRRGCRWCWRAGPTRERKSTRLNSSHVESSDAVFCL